MKAAVMGYGTVGSGVIHVLEENHDVILAHSGLDFEVKYVLDLRDFPGDPVQEKLVHDFSVIEQDPEISLVAEVMGGTGAAYEFTKRLLCAGKSVCTSNKELVAMHGTELLAIARDHQVSYLFEASCGGGIPLIRPLRTCLAQEEIDEITGIVNGTTNFILTQMDREDREFAEVLREAQELGYAERNPEADIEGHDACRKLSILSSLAYGKRVNCSDLYMEGISAVSSADMHYARVMGRKIRLLACSRMEDGFLSGLVAPFLVEKEDPLASVNGVFNAVFVHGNMLGDAMFYGRGAGKDATASAVVADLIELAQTAGRTVQSEWSAERQNIRDFSETRRRFFVRCKDPKETIESLFSNVDYVDAGFADEFGFLTEEISEKEFAGQAAGLKQLITRIRIR